MSTNSFDQLERLFNAARVLVGEEREAFIAAVCAGDANLRKELESLLKADESADDDSFLSPVADLPLSMMYQGESLRDSQIGPYKLLEPLGEGGMGEVWLAEQKAPIKRQVAFKVIKLGMDTKEVIARFESERQALAVMDHPNIAKVYDAGVTESGRPFFVMELVRGVSVDEFCDLHKLSTVARIRLFMDICRAVQHAHQKGVIHRDLKPSNVLVTMHDDKPVPKVIDFGIAKAVGFNLTARTLVTSMGQMVGTPAYMSPEQAEMHGVDVDTRTDVYSLGVMLYELLVGEKPLDLKAKAREAIHEAIRDSQIPKPSTRLTSLGQRQQTIAEYRQTTPEQLRKELRGDLDWIVLKSIEKDRTRRYETVNGLSMELARYLNKEPIVARPPSLTYRTKKFIQRNKTMVASATLVFIALIAGITAATIGFVRAKAAEEIANEEALTAKRVSDFMVDLFQVSDPSVARGNSITAREILDQGADRIENELQDEPVVRARLLHTIGQVYWELGLEEEAVKMMREAISLREKMLGPDHNDVAESLRELADIRGRHFGAIMPDVRVEILELLNRVREIHEKNLGPNHPEVAEDWFQVSVFTLTRLQREDTRDFESAIDAAEKALSIWEEAYGPDDPRLYRVLIRLGGLYRDYKGDMERAVLYLNRAVENIEGAYGPDHGLLLDPLFGLYMLEYRRDFRSPKTLELFQKMWEISDEAILDSDAYISNFINTGTYLTLTGYLEEAEASMERAARLLKQKFGEDVEDTVFAHLRLIQLYISQERWSEVIEKAAYTRPIWARNNSINNVAGADYYKGIAHAALGQLDDAEIALTEALNTYEVYSRRYDLTTTLWELGRIQRLQGRHQLAEATEARMRAAALESTRGELARDSDARFYALALLGCRELWKIRTPKIHCYGSPFDTKTALEYAEQAVAHNDKAKQNVSILAVAHHFAGNREEAIRTMEKAMSLIHENDPAMQNYQYWLDQFNR